MHQNDTIRISIITPSFNQGQFIERTIQSVLSQDVKGMEYWVIDGGSTDETLQVLQRFEDRLQWVSEPDKGQTDALNKGIMRSHGEIIGWLNSDDIYYPKALPRILHFFDEHPEVNVVYGKAHHIDADDGIIAAYPTQEWDYDALLKDCFICQPALFFRRDIIERYGLFDETLQYCMDYEYWLRVGGKEPFCHYPEFLAGSRLYEQNKTLGCRRQVREEILEMIYQKTGMLSMRWAIILGSYLAEQENLFPGGIRSGVRYARAVYRTVAGEANRRGKTLTQQQKLAFGRWWCGVFLRAIGQQCRRII